MPEVKTETSRKIIYTIEELKELVMNDLNKQGIRWDDTAEVYLKDIQVQTGTIQLGNFDYDPVFGFNGLEVKIIER